MRIRFKMFSSIHIRPSRKPDKLFQIFLAKRSGVSAERRQPDGGISDGGFLPKAATPPKTISPFRRRAFRLARGWDEF
jgi:hypothetical protein